MPLLHWATLVPSGESGIAALRFTAPLRISCLRVFPTGATPFPDLVACTEPEAFFLDIFFNALPTSPEAKEKQRPTNALVPTSIAYAGGEVDFEVDMGEDYATRLMIVKGEFQSLSIAIYGETVRDTPATSPAYEPLPLPVLNPLPLSETVDPASMLDPTQVANQLLDLIPNSPKLELIIRLMFCLKPSNEDWDLPEFPYLFADLEAECDAFNLDVAVDLTARPIPDDTAYDVRSAFASKVAESVGQKSATQAYLISKLLVVSASQHPDMARTLLQHVDMQAVFDSLTMDDDITLLNLLDAVSNADIARHFHSQWFFAELDQLHAGLTTEKLVKNLVDRLATRIRRWAALEDALVNPSGDFSESAQLLEDVGLEEQSIGIWLETMLTHPNMTAKLAETPVPADRRLPSASLLRRTHRRVDITHEELVAFTRAYIGVASVLAVWAWTDSLGNDACRTRTLAIVRLWQNVDGYREILTKRLQWITTGNDPPRQSGILAEQILADLAADPHAILSADVINAITALEDTPLAYIAEHERQSMNKLALVAQDNLPAAIEELTFSSSHPISLRRLRAIRVSLAIIQRELDDGEAGEWNVLEALWREKSHGLVERLLQLFLEISDDLSAHFGLTVPPLADEPLVVQLFRTADDLLRLITRVVGEQVITSRALRNLVSGIADVFACTHIAGLQMPHSEAGGNAGSDLRQSCLELVSTFIQPEVYVEPRKPAAEVVLRTLFEHAPSSLGRGRDPAVDVLQTLSLIDHILPQDTGTDDRWMTVIVPNTLFELTAFFRLLDPDHKVFVMTRLLKLDDGVIGVGEWLLIHEFKELSGKLEDLQHGDSPRVVEHHQLFLSLQFLSKLINSSADSSQWLTTTIASVPEVSSLLGTCLTALLDLHLVSPVLDDIIRVLAMHAESFDADLKSVLVLTTLRAFRREPRVLLDVLKQELPWDPAHPHYPALLRREIGQTLAVIAHGKIGTKLAGTALAILTWLTERGGDAALSGISPTTLSQLYLKLNEALPPASLSALKTVTAAIRVDEDDAMAPNPNPMQLPNRLELPLQDLVNLLQHPVPAPQAPSTPKMSHTPDILGVLTSPTGLLRSPAATGLTKTYQKNDFRALRQAPMARLNTSRLPSMHVDVGVIPGPPT
ncbi:hypothetical protein C8F01DRAFT_1208184 [Mycena amicta]|nr:hypothetical protein C8F01DRAFT_1208184 [Mycena amicta]